MVAAMTSKKQCGSCGKPFFVREERDGRSRKCPHCGWSSAGAGQREEDVSEEGRGSTGRDRREPTARSPRRRPPKASSPVFWLGLGIGLPVVAVLLALGVYACWPLLSAAFRVDPHYRVKKFTEEKTSRGFSQVGNFPTEHTTRKDFVEVTMYHPNVGRVMLTIPVQDFADSSQHNDPEKGFFRADGEADVELDNGVKLTRQTGSGTQVNRSSGISSRGPDRTPPRVKYARLTIFGSKDWTAGFPQMSLEEKHGIEQNLSSTSGQLEIRDGVVTSARFTATASRKNQSHTILVVWTAKGGVEEVLLDGQPLPLRTPK